MILIISSTNRIGACTRVVAGIYASILEKKGEECMILDLKDLPRDFIFSALFENSGGHKVFNEIQKVIDSCQKFVFVVPEYNGSFPGVLKAFIDGLRYPDSFSGKAGALVGLSSGSMGGALAVSHLTDVLNYQGMFVLPQKPRLSFIKKSLSEDNQFTNPLYTQLLTQQAEQLIKMTC
jgi:NAD(P)H-dependent FMN reductase